MSRVCLYCQLGRAVDMADFAIPQAIERAGLEFSRDFDLVFICWKTSDEAYRWLRDRGYAHVDMAYDEGRGFLWNLYKGWNLGHDEAFKRAPYSCPIATDHAFARDWLKNLLAPAGQNRIVNCKLIEPGILPSLHTTRDLGLTLPGDFRQSEFDSLCATIASTHAGQVVREGEGYGRRLDAMPFVCARDVWQRFGPMRQDLRTDGVTGDTDFFDRCRAGGVEILKALDAISYHCGGLETRRNEATGGVYT